MMLEILTILPAVAARRRDWPCQPARTKTIVSDRRASTALITSLLMCMLITSAALALDSGVLSSSRRRMQSAADMAAVAAVQQLQASQVLGQAPNETGLLSSVSQSLAANGFSGVTIDSLQLGAYCPNPAVTPAARFTPNGPPCIDGSYTGPVPNAVQIAVHQPQALSLAKLFIPSGTSTVGAHGTAAGIDEAGFAIGTGLVSLDTASAPVTNSVFGQVLGSPIDLSAVSYQGLANGRVSALDFMNALNIQSQFNIGTYGGLAGQATALGNVLAAASSVLAQPGQLASANAAALTAMQSLQVALYDNRPINVGSLFNVAAWQADPMGASTSPSALSADLAVGQLVTSALELSNGQRAIDIPVGGLNLPGVSNLNLSGFAGTPIQNAFVGNGVGSVGATVSTAQVEINVTLATTMPAISLSPLLGATVSLSLPVSVSLANGTATLTGIACGPNPATDATETVTGATSAATIDVVGQGTVSILSAGVTVISASLALNASAQVGQGGPTALTFTQNDVAQNNSKRISSADLLTTALASLSRSLGNQATSQLGVAVADTPVPGLNAALIGSLDQAIAAALTPLINNLDPIINGTAAAVGVQVGYMDVFPEGIRCGVPAVVL